MGTQPRRAPLTYRAYRFPHRRGRLVRRWRSQGRVAGFASLGIGVLLAVVLFTALLGTTALAFVAGDLPAVEDLKNTPLPLASYMYDRSGQKLLYTLAEERRDLVKLEDVPKVMQDATIAIEDKTFWSNPGVDPGGIVRAALENFRTGNVTQGASTITQQLIKTRLLGDERTVTRKVREAILAVEATQRYSKKDILEMYFNQIYYGQQSYGLKAAAKTYFGVADLSKLTLGQAALLAGLPQAPSAYDPVVNADAAKARRQEVLSAMVDLDMITADQAAAAAAEPISVHPATTPIVYPHIVFRAREELARLLGNDRAAYVGGYKILTSIDPALQEIAERDVRDRVNALKGANVNNGALIAMDPRTGQILAYVGSVDYNDQGPKVRGDFDVAGLGERQMGSSFKLYTYLTAFKEGMTPSTVLWDVSTGFGRYGPQNLEYRPHDAPQANGSSPENGPVTIRQALRESLNIPAIKVTSLVGVDAIIDTVHQLGIQRDWDRTQIGLSFGIGAGNMTLREHISGYQVVANMGVKVEPSLILKVIDKDGNVVVDHTKPQGKQVLDPKLAWLMSDILKDNTDPGPNGSWIFGSWTTIGRPAALKTGTTDDIRDVLAIGYYPQLLTAVWMGNSDNSQMFGISSAMGPGQLWQKFNQDAIKLYNWPSEWYPRPDGIVDRTVCEQPGGHGGLGTGMLPSLSCPSRWRVTEHFIAGTEPTTDDRAWWGPGCIQPVSQNPAWRPDILKWASTSLTGRLGIAVCGAAPPRPSSQPSPSGSPTPSSSPQPSTPPPQPTPTRKKPRR
jgi:membrane peptidoglycan carboxypeptidase